MAESDLKTFLEAAEELKVIGLTDTSAFKRDLGLAATKPVLKEKVESQPTTVAAPQQAGSNLYLNTGTTAATAGNAELAWLSDGDVFLCFRSQLYVRPSGEQCWPVSHDARSSQP